MSTDNKLDFIQGVNLQPWEWHNLGAVFGSSKENNQCVAARCNFVVRKGFDEVEQTQYGNVLEGLGDVGFNLRAKQYAFHVSASNLSYKQGVLSAAVSNSYSGEAGGWQKLWRLASHGDVCAEKCSAVYATDSKQEGVHHLSIVGTEPCRPHVHVVVDPIELPW